MSIETGRAFLTAHAPALREFVDGYVRGPLGRYGPLGAEVQAILARGDREELLRRLEAQRGRCWTSSRAITSG